MVGRVVWQDWVMIAKVAADCYELVQVSEGGGGVERITKIWFSLQKKLSLPYIRVTTKGPPPTFFVTSSSSSHFC